MQNVSIQDLIDERMRKSNNSKTAKNIVELLKKIEKACTENGSKLDEYQLEIVKQNLHDFLEKRIVVVFQKMREKLLVETVDLYTFLQKCMK